MGILDELIKFATENIFILVIIGVLGFFIFTYISVKRKVNIKIIDRKEVERLNFIESMRFNKSPVYKFLYRGNILLGRILNYLEFEQFPVKHIQQKDGTVMTVEDKVDPMQMIGMVIKPMLFWKFSNPFAKSQPILLENNGDTVKEGKGNKIIVPVDLGIDNLFGIYYAIEEKTAPKIRNIIDSRIIVSDFNLMASRYWVKGLEQSSYTPELAHQLAMKEKELEIELAKKRGKSESI